MNRNLVLWISVLGGPLIWLISFEARFAWVPWTCTFQTKLTLYFIALAALLVCGACAILGWRQWQTIGREPSADTTLLRSRFMAIGGMTLSLGCALIVIAQTIPEIILGPCQ